MRFANQTTRTRSSVRGRQIAVGSSQHTGLPRSSSADEFGSIAAEYLQRKKKHLTRESLNRVRKIVEGNLIPFFGHDRKIATFTSEDVSKYVGERSQCVSSATVNKEIGIINGIFQFAVESDLANRNPAIAVVRPPKPRSQSPRVLTRDEFARILDASPDWLQVCIRFSLFTGLRRGELSSIRWGDIVGNELHVQQTRKTQGRARSRIVPLSQSSRDLLTKLRPARPGQSEFIFVRPPATEANISQQFLRACRKAGVERCSFDQIRHTAITWMSRGGAGLEALSKYMGHRDSRSIVRYAIGSGSTLSRALDLLENCPQVTRKTKRSPARHPPKD